MSAQLDKQQMNTTPLVTLREKLSYLFLAVLVVSLFFLETVKVLPTIGLLGFLVTAFFRKDLIATIKSNKQNKSYLLLTVVFFVYALGYFFIEDGVDTGYWKGRFMVKIPFLLLPLALLATSQLSRKQYSGLYYLFFLITLITAIGSIINYVFHFDEINDLIRRSKALPVVVNHVRYSLFVCFSVFIAWKLHTEKFFLFSKHERWIYRIGGIFLILFLHVAAVRSGLIAFYGIAGLLVLYQVILKEKRYKLGGGILLLLVIVPYIAFISLTSVQNKVANMYDDLSKIETEERANNYSLTARWYSYKVGASIFQENKWLGIGVGNLKHAIKKTYTKDYPKIIERSVLEPHNQYLYWLVSFGVIGTIALLSSFFAPLFWKSNYPAFLVLHYLILALSFVVENSIETQLGANYIVLFCVIPFLDNDGSKYGKG